MPRPRSWRRCPKISRPSEACGDLTPAACSSPPSQRSRTPRQSVTTPKARPGSAGPRAASGLRASPSSAACRSRALSSMRTAWVSALGTDCSTPSRGPHSKAIAPPS
eukprot:4541911-Lingulodinium_polyedra.AAC.1